MYGLQPLQHVVQINFDFDNHLTGTIPLSIGNMSYLQVFNIVYNDLLNGTIPTQMCTLKYLTTFSIYYSTKLIGDDAMIRASETETILLQYYNILESPVLTYIDMKYNTFTTTNIDINNQNDIHNLTQTKYRGLYAGTDIVIDGKLNYKNVQTGITVSLFARGISG